MGRDDAPDRSEGIQASDPCAVTDDVVHHATERGSAARTASQGPSAGRRYRTFRGATVRALTSLDRRAILALVAAATVTTALTTTASASTVVRRDPVYEDTGYDPNDIPIDEGSCCQQDPDVRSTTRKVASSTRGTSLFITFRAYEPLQGYWTVRVKLDTRSGPRSDAKMRLHDSGVGPARCGVRFLPEGPRRRGKLVLPTSGDRATCRVPLRWVHPSKRIRWKLFSPAGTEGTEPGVDEYAPDDRRWFE